MDSFVDFVRDQSKDPVKEYQNLEELQEMDDAKRYLIGYFEEKNSPEYTNFRKVASKLKEDCVVYAGFGEASVRMHPPGQSIIAFRPNKARSNDDDETFTGNMKSYDELSAWASDKCTPLVREITFENAEELTEEGLPFLILFHDPEDNESIKQYSDVVQRELLEDKRKQISTLSNFENVKNSSFLISFSENVNFLIADGIKFAHPLHHLGKNKEDLPLIAIDSFRHMYLFPKYEDMQIPGKLKEFLKDLYSGKLHREFHYGPDASTTSDEPPQDNRIDTDGAKNRVKREKNPPPSQFQHLGPSKNRYTLLHDEF